MTPKTFFTLILKIFGLWLIIGKIETLLEVVYIIPMMLSTDIQSLKPSPALIIMLVITLIYIATVWLLLLKPELIIRKLSLDKNFDEQTLDMNLPQAVIIQIALIVFGALLITTVLPNLFVQLISYLQQKRYEESVFSNPVFTNVIVLFCKVLLGIFLMIKSRWLSQQISSNQQVQ
ncbi:MAG: hypothetical protein NTW54_05830 [Bacteroidetes bacterium]|nr:hypothetical protein [Bacteroidota bacterium]